MADPKINSGTTGSTAPCYHCGEDCGMHPVRFDEKSFCCQGCRTVFEILSKSDACTYYQLETHPGRKARGGEIGERYAYLDTPEIARELLDFSEEGIGRIKLFIPVIHCSSCIWLLENLKRFHPGILQSSVNFIRKEATITFRESEITLRGVVELLVSINYIPQIALDDLQKKGKKRENRGLIFRLGVAGFCFGNIMLFSFPAYLSVDDSIEHLLRQNFGLFNILLGIPVAFYSGSEYLISAWKGLRKRFISIDVPIAMGILALFTQSVYEILTASGPGFMDSLAGLVFFLLIGRWYQDKTYQALSFERDYRSYFPVAVTLVADDGAESIISLKNLKTGMRIRVRNQELIPADGLLVKGDAAIDYSFVTGESTPVQKREGDRIFAGGRQTGSSVELIVEREVEQSRLTELWNLDPAGQGKRSRWTNLIDKLGRNFTIGLLTVATISGIAWWIMDPSKAVFVVTSILIVACPCALALSLPFSFGGAMRVFGRNGFYLKRTSVVELLARADTIVFDKTGTITSNENLEADLSNLNATTAELELIRSLVSHSTHPSSVALYRSLDADGSLAVNGFSEIPASGIEGAVEGRSLRIGSELFVTGTRSGTTEGNCVFVSVDGNLMGFARLRNRYREGMEQVLEDLGKRYGMHLLSGDNDSEREYLSRFFPEGSALLFNQSPIDKLEYIRRLKADGKIVMMIGDGLNDAGALRESDCGISIADDIYLFSPSCDAILESRKFSTLNRLLAFSRNSIRIVKLSILFSLLYNSIGLSFAIAGKLTPIVSAILMPLSSVSVVGFITLAVMVVAYRMKLQ